MRNTLVIKQGDKYGRLSVVKELEPIVQPSGAKRRIVICECECGNTKTFRLSDLRSNRTKSCGCFQKQIVTKHNDAGKDKQHYYLHQTWHGIIKRCYNINSQAYKHYGQRGIKVCELFHDYLKFKEWVLTNLGERPENFSLDRINTDGNYEPNNIRWADKLTQTKNRRPFKGRNQYSK